MRILVLNQCFYPDVAAVAQHLSELSEYLVSRGHQVNVIAGNRAHDDPTVRFCSRETWKGVEISRVPVLGLGKKSILRRLVSSISFWFLCTLKLITLPRSDTIIVSTVPPLLPLLGAIAARLKRTRFVLWMMDMNPDEAIALGILKPSSFSAKLLEVCSRYSLRNASKIVALDRFMANRIKLKGVDEKKISIIPPWSHDLDVRFDESRRADFRARFGWSDKFVVMYSGNHTACHPLDTLLQTARRLQEEPDIVFAFVGGGTEFRRVQQFAESQQLANICCLPYQPLSQLSASLSSADLHVVVMGDPFVGIVHPCKVYNILAIGSPFLYIGPPTGHIPDLCQDPTLRPYFYGVRHGDVDGVISIIQQCRRNSFPRHGKDLISSFSANTLLPLAVEVLTIEQPLSKGDETAANLAM